MAEPRAISQIFDSHLRELRVRRAEKRMEQNGVSFLIKRCLDDAVDRVLDVNRRFETVYLVADFDLRAKFLSKLPQNKHPQNLYFSNQINQLSEPADLILCLLTLHNQDNPPDDIAHMSSCLLYTSPSPRDRG